VDQVPSHHLQMHPKGELRVLRLCAQGVQSPKSPAAAQLAVLDQLLWQCKPGTGGSSSSGPSANSNSSGGGGAGGGGGFRGWLTRMLLEFALGRLDVQLQGCCCQLVVPWQLGPQSLSPQTRQQQYDGVALSIRLLTISPSSPGDTHAAAASQRDVQGASLHDALGEQLTKCCKPWQLVGGWCVHDRSTAAAPQLGCTLVCAGLMVHVCRRAQQASCCVSSSSLLRWLPQLNRLFLCVLRRCNR
jgi:hypothetical protein